MEGIDSRQIPGIMRREENTGAAGSIPVGFASPYLIEGRRQRIAAFVPVGEIAGIITPYEVVQYKNSYRTPCMQALEECRELARKLQLQLGVWGSTGLEVYTGLPYTHNRSDLDLLITDGDLAKIKIFYEAVGPFQQKYGCKIDVEIDLPTGYGVKLREIFLGTAEILGKSLNDVQLFPRDNILKMLGGDM